MKKRFLRLLFLSGTLITLLTACEYDFVVPAPPTPAPPANDTISFSEDIQPFFNSKCISCHSGNIPPTLTAGQSYAAIVPAFVTESSPTTSELYTVCQPGGSMTTYATITSDELNLLYRWIYAGAKND
jgi:hypothetical protein